MTFAQELKLLLEKYNATICGEYDGDSHGVYNERIVIEDDKENVLAQGDIGSLYMGAGDIQ